MFKLSIAIKLNLITIGMLVVLSGALGFMGINSVIQTNELAIYVNDWNEYKIFFTEKEGDHLRWMSDLKSSVIKNEDVTVQMDYKKCGLGLFLYGDTSKTLANLDENIQHSLEKMKPPHIILHDSAHEIDELLKQNAEITEVMKILENQTIPSMEKVQKNIKDIKEAIDKHISQAYNEMEEGIYNVIIVIAVVAVVALFIGILLIWLMSRSITRPLARAVEFSQDVADGKLIGQLQVSSKDETGQLSGALNNMVRNLHEIIEKIIKSTKHIFTSSEQLSSTSQSMSDASQSQASFVEEMTASMEELTSSIESVASKINNVISGAKEAVQAADEGSEGAEMAINGMNAIEESASQMANNIQVINDIAEQTNLLALNASIEAARAGDAGRSFAVVAEQVTKLAEKSASAASEIDELITRSQADVKRGSDIVRTLIDIIEKMKVASDNALREGQLVLELTNEQLTGSKQVSDSATKVNELVQESAANAEEVAASASELSEQAEDLNSTIQKFEIQMND
jgi:methyl-accepting chemotaxis protein